MVFAVKIGKSEITTELIILKLKESNYIFLAVGDVLIYSTEPMHKKCCTTFIWGHPFSTYVSYDQS